MELLATLLLIFCCISLAVCILVVYLDQSGQKKRRARHSRLFKPRLTIPVRRPTFTSRPAPNELHCETIDSELNAKPQLSVEDLPQEAPDRLGSSFSPSFLGAVDKQRLQALRADQDLRDTSRPRSISLDQSALVPPARHLPRTHSTNTV